MNFQTKLKILTFDKILNRFLFLQVPPFLATIEAEHEKYLSVGDERGCSYCGGLGHRITNCPKLDAVQHKKAADIGRKDYLASNAADY